MIFILEMVNTKLTCTLTPRENRDFLIKDLPSRQFINYGKIFILKIKNKDEYACTYSIIPTEDYQLPENTFFVHRKKESNTLYTINALNELIKHLNYGVVNTNYKIEWNHYRNTLLITTHGELNPLKTTLYKIITV